LQEKIELKKESVYDLLEATKSSVEETFKQRDIALETICEINDLPMDFDLMLSLLINLVDNAAKASKAGQRVKIRAYENIIQVSDQGIGISKEEISRIIEPFYMVDPSRNKLKGGSGLGLALVKRIGDAHGAKLAIESKLGEGTTVKIIFPVYK
jgi:signal transduction histidine kinase